MYPWAAGTRAVHSSPPDRLQILFSCWTGFCSSKSYDLFHATFYSLRLSTVLSSSFYGLQCLSEGHQASVFLGVHATLESLSSGGSFSSTKYDPNTVIKEGFWISVKSIQLTVCPACSSQYPVQFNSGSILLSCRIHCQFKSIF